MSNGAGDEFQFSRALSGWWWLLRRDLRRILPVGLAWSVLLYISLQADQSLGSAAALSWVGRALIAQPLFAGIFYLLALSDGTLSPSAALNESLNRFISLLILNVITALGIGTGLILLLLPGVALAVLWVIAFPVMMSERVGPIDALKSSFGTVKFNFLPILGLLAIFTISTLIIGAILGFYDGEEYMRSATSLLIEAVVTAAFSIMGIYLNTAIYRELGYTGAHDVSVFD